MYRTTCNRFICMHFGVSKIYVELQCDDYSIRMHLPLFRNDMSSSFILFIFLSCAFLLFLSRLLVICALVLLSNSSAPPKGMLDFFFMSLNSKRLCVCVCMLVAWILLAQAENLRFVYFHHSKQEIHKAISNMFILHLSLFVCSGSAWKASNNVHLYTYKWSYQMTIYQFGLLYTDNLHTNNMWMVNLSRCNDAVPERRCNDILPEREKKTIVPK